MSQKLTNFKFYFIKQHNYVGQIYLSHTFQLKMVHIVLQISLKHSWNPNLVF